MRTIYMTYRNEGGSWAEYIPSLTLEGARAVAQDTREAAPGTKCKVKKLTVTDADFDYYVSEFALEVPEEKEPVKMTTVKAFGYARVSAKDQNEGRQLEALRKYVPEKNIIVDKASGKDFDRPQYQALKKMLRAGDELYIKSLDRLGRNKCAIKKELEELREAGVRVHILDVPTTMMEANTEQEKAIFDMINNLLIEVLGTIAEQERKNIRERQAEGIAVAKAEGRRLGRPTAKKPGNWDEVISDWKAGKITAKVAMQRTNTTRTTFYKLVKS